MRLTRPDKDAQSKLQSAVDTNRESLLTISNLTTEELIRIKSVAGPDARQYMHSTFIQPSMKDVPGFVHTSLDHYERPQGPHTSHRHRVVPGILSSLRSALRPPSLDGHASFWL